jgi:hypothetical protein
MLKRGRDRRVQLCVRRRPPCPSNSIEPHQQPTRTPHRSSYQELHLGRRCQMRRQTQRQMSIQFPVRELSIYRHCSSWTDLDCHSCHSTVALRRNLLFVRLANSVFDWQPPIFARPTEKISASATKWRPVVNDLNRCVDRCTTFEAIAERVCRNPQLAVESPGAALIGRRLISER